MAKIIPTSNFTGYPYDKKTEFFKGIEQEVPSEYADLLLEKELIQAAPVALIEEPSKRKKAN